MYILRCVCVCTYLKHANTVKGLQKSSNQDHEYYSLFLKWIRSSGSMLFFLCLAMYAAFAASLLDVNPSSAGGSSSSSFSFSFSLAFSSCCIASSSLFAFSSSSIELSSSPSAFFLDLSLSLASKAAHSCTVLSLLTATLYMQRQPGLQNGCYRY